VVGNQLAVGSLAALVDSLAVVGNQLVVLVVVGSLAALVEAGNQLVVVDSLKVTPVVGIVAEPQR